MLIKINNKPIKITPDTNEDKETDYVYLAVSTVGYLILGYVMDYVCYTFFYIHPFPFLNFIGVILSWLF